MAPPITTLRRRRGGNTNPSRSALGRTRALPTVSLRRRDVVWRRVRGRGDSPPCDDLLTALEQEDTRRDNAADARAREAREDWPPHPWISMGFGDVAGDQDAASEVSMGVSESEMYRAHTPKRRLADRSPQQHRDSGGGPRQIACPSPPDDFGDRLVDGRSAGRAVLGAVGLPGRAVTTLLCILPSCPTILASAQPLMPTGAPPPSSRAVPTTRILEAVEATARSSAPAARATYIYHPHGPLRHRASMPPLR